MKKTVSLILVVLLICALPSGLFSQSAAAASPGSVPPGYKGIYSAEDLAAVNLDPSGSYILMNDIDLSSYGNWEPLCTSYSEKWNTSEIAFSGVFDGNGHTITNMIISDGDYDGDAGLFASLEGAEVRNLTIGGSIRTEDEELLCAGAVAGSINTSYISNCHSYVSISYHYGDPCGGWYTTAIGIDFTAGGIAGYVYDAFVEENNSVIEYCSNHGEIKGVSECAPMSIGGIVGSGYDFTVHDCYNAAALSAETDFTNVALGGIVGDSCITFSEFRCKNCYNIGKLHAVAGSEDGPTTETYVGGISGSDNNSSDTKITSCYYLNGTAPAGTGWLPFALKDDWTISAAIDITGCSDSEMTGKSTFAGFDFNTVWSMGGQDYPYPVLSLSGGRSAANEDGHLCKVHTFTSAGGDYCTVCGYKYEAELVPFDRIMYTVNDVTAVRTQPYAKCGASVRNSLKKDDSVHVTHYLNNSLGNKWYLTEDGYYIYSERLSETPPRIFTLRYETQDEIASRLFHTQTTLQKTAKIITSVPTRNGYIFVGWSVDTASYSAILQPGSSIQLEDDIILSAVWYPIYNTDGSLSAITKQKLAEVEGFKQIKDFCTSAATAVMIRRFQVLHGHEPTYNFYDIRMSFESMSRDDALNNKSIAKPSWQHKFTDRFSGTGKESYQTRGRMASWLGKTAAARKSALIELLRQHPEGVVIYGHYSSSKHAILLSRYEPETDTFYAYDSEIIKKATDTAGKLEQPLAKSILYTGNGESLDKMLMNLMEGTYAVWYIESSNLS